MAIQRWDPLRDLMELQQKISRLFDETLTRSGGADDVEGIGAGAWKPPTDLFEDDVRYVLRADLPGVAAGDVDIKIEDGTLFLRGERKMDAGVSREAYLRVERPYGRFAVKVALAPSVDQGAIRASHRNGVVEVLLPKKKKPLPSQIQISAK